MRRTLIIAVCFIILLFNAFPLGVDVDELESVSGKQVRFINYTGENPRFTADEIRSWGGKMASDLEAGKAEGRYYNFFSVIHVVDPSEEGKFDADIFSISKYGGVNHIDTLRLILQGFFTGQYGYSQKNTRTLAYFITVYNAVHRGDITYLGTRYKNRVMGYLSEADAGIALHYKEWPGKTKMLIPLSEDAAKGDINSLDMGEITDDETIEAIREQEDRGIEEREDMNELREDAIEEDEQQLEEDRQQLEEEREQVEEDREQLEEDKQQVEEDKQQLEEDKEQVEEIEDEEERAAEEERIAEEEERITQEEERIEQEEEQITEEEERITQEEDRITQDEERITRDREELEEDKEELERDKMIEEAEEDTEAFVDKVIEERDEDERMYRGKFYYLKVKDYLTGGHYNNEMYIIDAPTGDIVAEAKEKNICGRKYDTWAKGVVVITHTGSHEAGHYLSILDLDTLEELVKGEDNIFHRSFVDIRDNFVYAIIIDGSNNYLGKFDDNLELVAQSTEPVYADTSISFYRDRLYINNSAKEILALRVSDLSLIEKIAP